MSLDQYPTLEELCKSIFINCPTDPDERLELREAWINRNKTWANFKLHTKFDVQCDSDNCGFCRNNK